jgi:hypothetical protein
MGILKNNIVIAILAIILLSAAGAYYLMREPEDNSLLVSESVDGQGGVERELLTTLLELKSLRFEPAIFGDDAFNNLKDFSREIPDEPYGRNNPFAPVGKDTQPLSSATTTGAR